MTVNMIKLLLHIFVQGALPADFLVGDVEKLIDMGLVNKGSVTEYKYECTDQGNSYAEFLRTVPVDAKSAMDTQVGGNHYKTMNIQVVEFAHANSLGYLQGNVIKYICRYKLKGGIEDLKKAKHYVELLIDLEGTKEEVEYTAGEVVPKHVDTIPVVDHSRHAFLYEKGKQLMLRSWSKGEIHTKLHEINNRSGPQTIPGAEVDTIVNNLIASNKEYTS